MIYFCRGNHWSPVMVYWKFHQAAESRPNFFWKKFDKKLFWTPLKAGAAAPAPPFRSFERPKALPLETASFLKKAGQKLLVSLHYLLVTFCFMSQPQNKQNTEKWRRQLAALKSLTKTFIFGCRIHVILWHFCVRFCRKKLQVNTVTKLKVFARLFSKSRRFPKAEPLVARTSETGVRGRQPLPLKAFKKVFCQTFSKKSLCERSSQNRNNQISPKTQRATNGRPLWFTGNFIRRLKAAQPFFIKRLPKNFLERL